MQMNSSSFSWNIRKPVIHYRYPGKLLKGIEYNSSMKGKSASDKEIMSINCESEKWDTEVEKDKKVSFDNVTNAG